MVPLMKSTASSNWDKALCYKPDFRQAMIWFHFDFQTLIYLISFFSVWTWSRQSASTEDVPKKKKKMEHVLPVWTQPWKRGERLSAAHYSWRPPLHSNTHVHTAVHICIGMYVCILRCNVHGHKAHAHACMHACMQEGIHLHTMLKIQLSPTPVSVALAACVCVIRL